jgi:succinate dehydrogenase flavin-adding protein (antitoxin of CptAB toxin-antitoxin module)
MVMKPTAITQIAQLITALSIISNDKFKETLKLSDSDVLNYITKLGSDSSVAAKLVEISKKSPSQLTALTTLLTDFQKLDQGKKQELVGQITKLDTKLQALCAELEKTTAQEKQEIDKVAQTAVPNLTL